MVAGREAGRADIADDLPLVDIRARHDALGKRALVAVAGLVAVGMPDQGEVAVAEGRSDLLDDAIAGRHDRRAMRCGIVDPSVQAPVAEDRVDPPAEAGSDDADAHWLAHQELLRALAL